MFNYILLTNIVKYIYYSFFIIYLYMSSPIPVEEHELPNTGSPLRVGRPVVPTTPDNLQTPPPIRRTDAEQLLAYDMRRIDSTPNEARLQQTIARLTDERDELLIEKDALINERNEILIEKEALIDERDANVIRTEEVETSLVYALRDRGSIHAQEEQLRQERRAFELDRSRYLSQIERSSNVSSITTIIQNLRADLICPLKQELPDQPVIASDGKLYEKELLNTYIRTALDSHINPVSLTDSSIILLQNMGINMNEWYSDAPPEVIAKIAEYRTFLDYLRKNNLITVVEMEEFKNKYLKYKNKFLNLRKQIEEFNYINEDR